MKSFNCRNVCYVYFVLLHISSEVSSLTCMYRFSTHLRLSKASYFHQLSLAYYVQLMSPYIVEKRDEAGVSQICLCTPYRMLVFLRSCSFSIVKRSAQYNSNISHDSINVIDLISVHTSSKILCLRKLWTLKRNPLSLNVLVQLLIPERAAALKKTDPTWRP